MLGIEDGRRGPVACAGYRARAAGHLAMRIQRALGEGWIFARPRNYSILSAEGIEEECPKPISGDVLEGRNAQRVVAAREPQALISDIVLP